MCSPYLAAGWQTDLQANTHTHTQRATDLGTGMMLGRDHMSGGLLPGSAGLQSWGMMLSGPHFLAASGGVLGLQAGVCCLLTGVCLCGGCISAVC